MHVTPFPAMHTSANANADAHVDAARRLAEESEQWLAAVDAALENDDLRLLNRAAPECEGAAQF